ncbi:MAG: carboxypeptidase-like regulatory domain-containing protein, partial [Acidimicrobiia bacterium]
MSRRSQFRLLVALTIVWAAWAGWSLLGRATPYELRVLDDLGAPVASAVADVDGNQVGTSGSDGRIQMEWNRSSVVLEVSAPGHVAQMLTLAEPPEGVLDVVIKARVLRGRVTDSGGQAVDSAVVMASPSSGMTDGEGQFNIRGAEPGEIVVEKPAWLPASFTWDGGPGEVLVELAPFIARAVHMS